MPDVAIFKIRPHEMTGEYSLGLSVEALHTAIDHATCVIGEVDHDMPFTLGQSAVDASSLDYLVDDHVEAGL
jgi:acyl-CoA hydrolase